MEPCGDPVLEVRVPPTAVGGACYVKFAAARPGPGAEIRFHQLLDAILAHASARAIARLVAGVNTARHEAYPALLARGFHTDLTGIAMHRPDEPFTNRPGVFVMDDWR